MTRKEIAAMFNAVDLDFSKVLADVRAGHYDRAADTFDHAVQTITGFLDSVDPDAFWDEKRDAFFLLADAIQDNLSRPSQTRQKYDALYHDLLQWLSSITVLNVDMSAYALGYTDGNSYSAEYQPDVDALKLGAGSGRSVQSRIRSGSHFPQFIDTLNDEIGSPVSQGVRSRSGIFSARHSKTELKRVHHNILGMLDEAVSYVSMHRDSFNPRELMSILSAAPQALAILAEGMRDIDFEVSGELRSIGRHIEDMIADLRFGASDVNLDYLMGDLMDYLGAIDSFRSYLTSSRARSYVFRQLSSGVKDYASIMDFCDYWELERDHRGILMDELDTDDVDEVFPWDMMLDAMDRAKVNRTDEWYSSFTDY